MSYNIVDKIGMSLREGVRIIQKRYPSYNSDKLFDEETQEQYSIQMIEKALPEKIYMKSILKMIIFDCLIGNSDRHQSNWAEVCEIKHNSDSIKISLYISPLYDNGSSLCSYVNEEEIDLIAKDAIRFEALVNTKSKSAIGWENIRPIRHFELLEKIKYNYFQETKEYVKIIEENINETNIKNILKGYSDAIISKKMKELLMRYIIERKNRIIEIYKMKDE